MTRNIPDVVLERYRLKELPERSAQAIEYMMARDPSIRERLDALAASDADIQQRYPSSIFVHDRPAPPRRLVFQLATAVALGLAALLLIVTLPRTPQPPVETERLKGSVNGRPSLSLYRRTDTGSERLADGDIARAGDLLRVGYTSAGRPYGLILSIDGRGAVTLHLPPAGDRAVALVPGKTTLLDAAYELDEAPRIERFYFVTGKEPFAAEPVISLARDAARQGVPLALPLPPGLEQVTFAIQKEARK
jgi:hypothetical protein